VFSLVREGISRGERVAVREWKESGFRFARIWTDDPSVSLRVPSR
jgi:hypothetical protein